MYVDGVIDGTRTRAQCPPSPQKIRFGGFLVFQ